MFGCNCTLNSYLAREDHWGKVSNKSGVIHVSKSFSDLKKIMDTNAHDKYEIPAILTLLFARRSMIA